MAVALAALAALERSLARREAAVNVPEHHNHDSRDGLYVDPAFTPAAAAGLKRDLAFDGRISGNVYAQPLYIEGGPGGKAMIIAVTESNNVYALDAADGSVIWQRNVGPPVPLSSLPCGDINPLGITGTPVVDLPSRALLFDAMTTPDNGATMRHLIYSMNVDTGTTNSGWPVDVNATATSGSTVFTSVHAERAGRAGGPGRHRLCALRRPRRRLRYLLRLAGRRAAEQSRQRHGVGHRERAAAVPGLSAASASDGVNPFIATGNTFGASAWSGGEAIIRFQPGPVFSGLTN